MLPKFLAFGCSAEFYFRLTLFPLSTVCFCDEVRYCTEQVLDFSESSLSSLTRNATPMLEIPQPCECQQIERNVCGFNFFIKSTKQNKVNDVLDCFFTEA